jgi:hypothetical protein
MLSPEAAVEAAREAAAGPADEAAARSGGKLFFWAPDVLVAGAPARLYFNRARSATIRNNPNVKARVAFNHWASPIPDLTLSPTGL